MKLSQTSFCLLILLSASAFSAELPKCERQTVENSVIEMCLIPGEASQHDMYTMKIDNTLVFSLIDDYSEKVELEHTIPPGMTIELPLSKQGTNPIKITGGCVPESKDGYEVARLCNFHWGKFHVVKDVRFEFK